MVDVFSVSPVSDPIQAVFTVPGDKSISHRVIILAAISNRESIIFNLLFSEDVLMTINAMRALGVVIHLDSEKQSAQVNGVGLYGLKPPVKPIDCGNSGTTMRLLAGLLAAQSFDAVLIGDDSLMKRPMARVAEPLRLMGAKILLSAQNTAPIQISGGQKLQGIEFEPSVASAQVKSCILLAGLYASGQTIVNEPIKTRDHTERLLGLFHGPSFSQTIDIPGDISSAAFFMVAAAIVPGSDIVIRGVGVNPYRTGVITILRLMGADIEIFNPRLLGEEPVADIRVRYTPLRGIQIPSKLVSAAIDEFPILFVAASCAKGVTILHGASELRVKETDRIAAMARGLTALGVPVTVFDDGLQIEGVDCFQGGCVNSEGDHRVAMALTIAATRAVAPIKIQNTACIATSFPDFVALSRQIGLVII